MGRRARVRILCAIDFTSKRKRSSVLVHIGFPEEAHTAAAAAAGDSSSSSSSSSALRRGQSSRDDGRGGGLEGKILLFTKGADTVLLPLLANIGPLEEEMIATMEEYARDGLRTLCIAKREIGNEEFVRWYRLYEEAENTNVDRQEKIEQ